MELESCYKIGWVMRPHGLKGEVTVTVDAAAPGDLGPGDAIFLEQNNRLVPYFIEAISAHGKKAYIKFEDVNTHDDASKISKQSVYLEKSKRPASAGEVYGDDIIGFEVFDKQNGDLGRITQIIQAGPNKLLEVTTKLGKEVLIPVNGPFILDISDTDKTILVDLPEGFLDI